MRRGRDGVLDLVAPESTPLAGTTWDDRRGERATLVQFSTAFCAPCRAARLVLADVAGAVPGVVHLDVDAESELSLVRAVDVRQTPTTVLLDGAGREVLRAAGVPRREQLLAALVTAASG